MILTPPYKNFTNGFCIKIDFLYSKCLGLYSSSESRKEINLPPDEYTPSFFDMASPLWVFLKYFILEYDVRKGKTCEYMSSELPSSTIIASQSSSVCKTREFNALFKSCILLYVVIIIEKKVKN